MKIELNFNGYKTCAMMISYLELEHIKATRDETKKRQDTELTHACSLMVASSVTGLYTFCLL